MPNADHGFAKYKINNNAGRVLWTCRFTGLTSSFCYSFITVVGFYKLTNVYCVFQIDPWKCCYAYRKSMFFCIANI